MMPSAMSKTLCRKVFIITGAVGLLFVMLKFFAGSSKKSEEKAPDLEESKKVEVEVNSEPDQYQVVESKTLPLKRSLEDNKKVMKLFKPKPNFLIAFQVYNVEIHKKVKALQKKLISNNPSLHPALVNVSTLHVTLVVIHLANETQIKTAKDKLDEWAAINLKTYFKKQCILNFSGVNSFRNVVAYVDIKKDENYETLCNVANSLNNFFMSVGFNVDNRPFTPHLTFLKLSKDFRLCKSRKKFQQDFKSLKTCQDYFGEQNVTHLQLLSMNKPKNKFGYYQCFHQIEVSDKKINEDDHSECCEPLPKPEAVQKK